MELIVAGATGFVSTEVIRQSLSRREITFVIALARKPVLVPNGLGEGADPSKLRSVGIKDYEKYLDDVKKEFAGAGRLHMPCGTLGVSPGKAMLYDWEELKHICQTGTVAGMEAMYEAGPSRPFRFLYISGETAERDQTKKPALMAQFTLMRGEVENQVLSFAAEHDGVEAAVVRPALIYAPGELLKTFIWGPLTRLIIGAPSISTVHLAKIMLDQVIRGFEKDPLQARDRVRLSKVIT
ncbi:hypothetical protein AAE478_007350 [Parahypoxylon ruwenzoriense]